MKKIVLVVFALGLCATSVRLASAGYKLNRPVYIYVSPDGGGYAYGSLGAARAAADYTQYVGCSMSTYEAGAPVLSCYASDRNGVRAECFSDDVEMQRVAGMNGDLINFSFDKSGTCTFINIQNQSFDPPKAP